MQTHMARRSALIGLWCRSFSKSTFNACCWKSAFDFELSAVSGLSIGDYKAQRKCDVYAKSSNAALTVQMTGAEI
jgi:hypothetical protein